MQVFSPLVWVLAFVILGTFALVVAFVVLVMLREHKDPRTVEERLRDEKERDAQSFEKFLKQRATKKSDKPLN